MFHKWINYYSVVWNYKECEINIAVKVKYFIFQMSYLLYFLLLLINTLFERMFILKITFSFTWFYIIAIQCQCSGGIWPITDTQIGSFTVSWRYNLASNTVQFIIQGSFVIYIFILLINSLWNTRTSNR